MPVTPQPALSAPRCPVFPRCEQVNASRTHPAQADCRGPQTGPGIGADCTNHQTECCAREATVLVPPIPPPGQPPPGKPASPGWQTAATDSIARRRTIHSPNSHHGRICLCGGNLRVDPSRRAVRTTASRTNRLLWGRRSRNTASEPGVPVSPLEGPERSSTRVLAVHSALPFGPDSPLAFLPRLAGGRRAAESGCALELGGMRRSRPSVSRFPTTSPPVPDVCWRAPNSSYGGA